MRTKSTRRPAWVAGLAALAACGAGVPVSLGQAAKPEPGCAGLYADRKGDAEPENLDITGFWFDFAGGKLTANMRIANLTKDRPSEATGISWYVLWNVDDVQHFVTASIEVPDTEPSFSYGTVEEAPNGSMVRQGAGETAGQFFEGPDGVIQMEVPADVGGNSGTTLRATVADTSTLIGIPGVLSSIQPVDDASGRPYTAGACETAGPPAPPGPTPTPEVAAGQLDVSVSKKVPRARKVRRSLSLKVTSRNGISDVDAALYRGAISSNKVAGRGRLARAKGARTLKLRISRRIKKGAYTLYLAGRNADGTTADKTVRLRFR